LILVDTSAWVEYLRRTESGADQTVEHLLESGELLATTETVMMEILAGARDERHAGELRRFLLSLDYRPLVGLADFEQAASIYRICRRGGDTVRSLADCLIAAVALREGLSILAYDRDFEAIARHTGIELHSNRGAGPA